MIHTLGPLHGGIEDGFWSIAGRVFEESEDCADWAKQYIVQHIQVWHMRFASTVGLEELLSRIPRLAAALTAKGGLDGRGYKLKVREKKLPALKQAAR